MSEQPVQPDAAQPEMEAPAEQPIQPGADAPAEQAAQPESDTPAEQPAQPEEDTPAEQPAQPEEDTPAEQPIQSGAETPAEQPIQSGAETPGEEVASVEPEPATAAHSEPESETATSENASEEAPAEPEPEPEPGSATAEPVSEPEGTSTASEPESEPATDATEAGSDEAPPADPAESPQPARPASPTPTPTPAMFAARRPAVPRPPAGAESSSSPTTASPAPPAEEPTPPSDSVRHGRVDEDGTVHVRLADGSERAVGSYPGASPEEALAYFARKYDELGAAADLLAQRLAHTDVSAHDARQSLAHLKEQIGEAHVVGDLAALEATVAGLEETVAERSAVEARARAEAKARATTEREALVLEAETLAATEPAKVQWKQASNRIRDLLDEWKAHQRSGPRLDKDVENALWKRFSHARTAFDKMRKTWFAQLDEEHGQAKSAKVKLVAEAEALSTSTDWGATAGAFKRLMQEWKRAGRASRSDDDALWARFKAAQDAFFDAKDQVVAAEEAEFSENLKVKEELLREAEALPVDTEHLDGTKAALRRIQDRWEAAGKVPRADVRRVEGRLRAVEQKVRDVEDTQWQRTDPELAARAQSMVDQLERGVQGLESDLAAAQAAGDEKRIARLTSELETKRTWLESARGGLS
ncbi:DUF349 domain-containing protein [Ornithinimicrobium sp. W1665]|uniref:DUF349 domain-containing protein n=1 Tax=Ornithinimicrobium sp. W1665 TaxID=3416666 RepID=UPI003CE8A0B4